MGGGSCGEVIPHQGGAEHELLPPLDRIPLALLNGIKMFPLPFVLSRGMKKQVFVRLCYDPFNSKISRTAIKKDYTWKEIKGSSHWFRGHICWRCLLLYWD